MKGTRASFPCLEHTQGRSFTNVEQAAHPEKGSLVVKGVKSMWRQSAPVVQKCLQVCESIKDCSIWYCT